MDEADYATFEKIFGRICGAFRLKFAKGEQADLTRTYFKVLEPYDLKTVVHVGRGLLEKFKKFPTLADWITDLGGLPENATSGDVRQMTVSELAELTRAEGLRYYDHPCLCSECCRAGVDDRPLRFVPTLLFGGDEDRAFHPRRKRVEVVGHWAHGDELRRWYEARDVFFAKWRRHTVTQMLRQTTREPGEDD